MNDRCIKYDELNDLFEYKHFSVQETIKICNEIIEDSMNEKDMDVLWSMYDALSEAACNVKVAEKLDVDKMLTLIGSCELEVAEAIATILGFTGNIKYYDNIKYIGSIYEGVDTEYALMELNARVKNHKAS